MAYLKEPLLGLKRPSSRLRNSPTVAHLCTEELLLLWQDPGAGVEVVLLWEQLLHGPNRPAGVDLAQHLDHA